MTVLSHPHLSSASSSRPISTFCASDEDEEDPWAVKGDTPAPSQAMTQDPRQPVENVGYSINDDEQDDSNAYNAAPYSPPPPAFSDEDDNGAAGMGGVARKSRGSDEVPRSTHDSSSSYLQQQQQRQHRSTPSSSFVPANKTSSSLDPWATGNSQPSSAWGVNRSPAAATAPSNTSSAIRGGFTGPAYGNQDDDEDEQDFDRPPPAPRSPPGPSSWVAVELRPDVEGLIFKYNSYNVIRRPLSTGDEADDLTASSARLLDTTRKTRLQSSSRPGASAYTAPPLPSSLAYASASSANTTVVRRYSDFVWLNDILLRRYPFRLVPVLPPKRLSIPVGGRNLSDSFIEKRRRGLQRYLRAVVSHPVLSADDIVQVFLSDKQAMSEYKLSHPNISLEEESTIALPPSTALVTVPRDLSTKLDLTTTQTPTMVDRWSTLCTLFERIAKRIESQGGDYARLGSLIDAISQGGGAGAGGGSGVGRSTSPPTTTNSTSSSAISSSTSSALASSLHRDFSDLCTVRSRSLTLHALEGLKTQRDLWLSWRDLLARHVALAGDNVPALKAQVASTRAKLAALNGVAPAQRPPTFHADVAKVEETLRADSLLIERLLQRRERVRAAMWEELGLLNARKEEVAGVWREWCKEELLGRAAQKRAVEECWAQMSGAGGASAR